MPANPYQAQVQLLVRVLPLVAVEDCFALKGGTAINLFIRDMPRLSVDIDLAYLPVAGRAGSLAAIQAALLRIKAAIEAGIQGSIVTTATTAPENKIVKLMVSIPGAQIKIEANPVLRGSVYPAVTLSVSDSVEYQFGFAEIQVLSFADLYGGKLVAAMDRQHPRDLFDVWQMFESDGLTDAAVECFVTYLAGHNRPTHEVLFSNDKDIASEYADNFVGMTTEPVALDTLLQTRERLRSEMPRRLTDKHRDLLIGLARAEPDWVLLQCPHAAELPALRWKLANLRTFRLRRPQESEKQATILEAQLR